MVGAKEFAINRKVIGVKRKNPLAEKISIPKVMKNHESLTHTDAATFLDKVKVFPRTDERDEDIGHYAPRMALPYDHRTINPILADSEERQNRLAKKIRKPQFFHNFEEKRENSTRDKLSRHENSETESFSEEIANRISYKIFQNIKRYLERDIPHGNKQIKLEISL